MDKCQVSALTATGDTTKTIIDTLQVPQGAKRIKGIVCQAVAAATLTTGEAVTGILELESPDINLNPSQWILDCVTILTSGAVAFNPRIYPVDIPVKGGERISGYVTMDMAQTGGLKARFGLIYDF
jgi:LSD1 subclass zinc finger protein